VPPAGRQRRISVKEREKSVYGLTVAGLLMEAAFFRATTSAAIAADATPVA
jgi:hypothetical protein